MSNSYVPRQQYANELPTQTLGGTTLYANTIKKDTGTIRYFSGIDAELYFGDIYIDELVQYQFQLQQNVMPITGYNSYVYDDVAVGSRIIQGQFVVNFTKSNYLIDVLKTLKTANANKQGMSIPDDQYVTPNTRTANNGTNYIQGGGPLWEHNFEMVISYGGAQAHNPGSQMIVIGGIQITGVSQQFDVSGQPVLEVYSFIGRDIKNVAVAAAKAPAKPTPPKPKEIIPIVFNKAVYTKHMKGKSTQAVDGNMVFTCTVDKDVTIKKVAIKPAMVLTSKVYSNLTITKNNISTFKVAKQLALDIDKCMTTTLKSQHTFPLDVQVTYVTKKAPTKPQIYNKRINVTAISKNI